MGAEKAAECPDENLLVSLIEGRLGDAAVRELEDHLDVCQTCDSVFGELAAVMVPSPDPAGRPANDFMIGRYQVLGEVGAGAMGVVYAALDPELGRKVALKLLHPDLAHGHFRAAARARLLREARLLAGLNHPNVLSVYECGVSGDQVFIAVELIEGHSLDVWYEQAHPWRRVVEIYSQAGRGLAAAHRAGLIHRDVKPANIMLGHDGRVRVTDFGLATASQDSETSGTRPSSRADTAIKTQTGAVVGTPAYMAPEQLAGRRVDARSDQFSFAVALGEALVGERPIAGASVEDLEEARIASKREPFPAELCEIVSRGLRARAAERFEHLDEMVASLERLLALDAVEASIPSAPDAVKLAVTAPPPPITVSPPSPVSETRTPARNRSWLYGAAALLAVGGAWAVGRSSVIRPQDAAKVEPTSGPASTGPSATSSSLEPASSPPALPVPSPSQSSSSVPSPLQPSPSVPPAPYSAAAPNQGPSPSPSSNALSLRRGPIPATPDEESAVIGIERAHDSGDGAACLAGFATVRKTNPALAARTDLQIDEAQCVQMTGDCAGGRKRLSSRLSASYSGAALEDAVDAVSIAKCRNAKPTDSASPDFKRKRDAVQKLSQSAQAARAAHDSDQCRAVGAEARELVLRENLGAEPQLKALVFGVTQSVVMCLAESGDTASCSAARSQWRDQYRALYPELVAKGLDDANLDAMFHSSFPKCP